MPKFPQLYDVSWLQKMYTSATTRQIAHLLGCAPSLVTVALHRAGISLRPAKRSGPPELSDSVWLHEQYQRLTTHGIAAFLQCAQKSVLMAMRRHHITLRGHGKRRRVMKDAMHKGLDGKYHAEYRFMMEEHLGRSLCPEEHVHHIDGNHENNALENLIVLTKSAHHRLHAHQQPHKGKLSDDDVRMIRILGQSASLTHKIIAQRFQVSGGTISAILRGKAYKAVL